MVTLTIGYLHMCSIGADGSDISDFIVLTDEMLQSTWLLG